MNARGVTIIEILVALSVLAIGAVALSAWQVAVLRVAIGTRDLNRVIHVAESELGRRLLGGDAQPGCDPVLLAEAAGVGCETTIEACAVAGLQLSCTASGNHFPQRVTVTAASTRPGGPVVSLSALRRGPGGP